MRHLTLALAALLLNAPRDAADKDAIVSGNTRFAVMRLVLTNAVYFMGDWEQPFDPRETRDGEFHVSDKKTVTVPLMHHDTEFRHMSSRDAIGLEMPYKGRDLSMIVLLPPEKRTLVDLEKTLTADNLKAWIDTMKPGRVIRDNRNGSVLFLGRVMNPES